MKKFIICGIAAVMLMSCRDTDEGPSVDGKKDSLEAVNTQRISPMDAYMSNVIRQIRGTLDTITHKQQEIYFKTDEPMKVKPPVISEVNTEIAELNGLLEKNRQRIMELNNELKKEKVSNQELQKSIRELNIQLSGKQNELTSLNNRLRSFHREMDEVQTVLGFVLLENALQETLLQGEIEASHVVYYAIGTSKELQRGKVIDKKGGLLGIGKTSAVKKDFDLSNFIMVDYTQTRTLPINSDKIEIVTTHPERSYEIQKENGIVRSITITDPTSFWEFSKFLVIVKS